MTVGIDDPDGASTDLLAGIELVVFDKDGTLIDFHLMWSDWVASLADRLAAVLDGRRLDLELAADLGLDVASGRVHPHGALAATPMARLRDVVAASVRSAGFSEATAGAAVSAAWHAPDPVSLARPLADLPALFANVARRGARAAIATSDDREPTERTLDHLGVRAAIAAIACADDGLPVKPDPAAVLRICRQLEVDPARALVIGDAPADLLMGRAAGAGRVVGVLSGVGDPAVLRPIADALIPSVGALLPAD